MTSHDPNTDSPDGLITPGDGVTRTQPACTDGLFPKVTSLTDERPAIVYGNLPLVKPPTVTAAAVPGLLPVPCVKNSTLPVSGESDGLTR